ncbi:terminase small subunit [Aliikangiella sp. G2MR2-5]|uniref:terminase small subunit n=1 Tax=Aliikangiella sp. G2MR2-5 TaxID=2788943 RepID=UPI0018ABEA47|nr:terminase small subunit [Aliikangiella sp. G2MR2-5]
MRSSNYLRRAKRRQNKTTIHQQFNYSPNDKVCGKDSLASVMDVTITTVERWIRDGMPVEQRGDSTHEWLFDLTQVKQWYSEHFPKND